ncbi:GCN5-related N-acetyltransferase-like protein [Pyrenochaeta sp. MPI-SDFR-AT-0127]|nr:GCN5-related N-acetyltransferase-like protein [Pyrenochaeta sp. MPI-SDFR-AT-0127]
MGAQLESSTIPPDGPIPQPILTTSRLIIRPMHPQDKTSMAQYANNPIVAKYMSLAFPDPYTLSSAETWITTNLKLPHQNNFGIAEKGSPNVHIGGIGLKPGDDVNAHTAEVGFWVGVDYWGKGYTTEALEAFTRWAFETREIDGKKLTRLWGGVFSGNVASMRCFEKCGYSKEGVLKGHCVKRGEVMDMHVFGMTKGDWEKRISDVFNNQ